MNSKQKIVVQNETMKLKTIDIAKNLNIAESTVRKYFNELSKSNYSFLRDTTGSRCYQERDQKAISKLLEIRKETGVSLEMAATIVATRIDGSGDVQPLSLEVLNNSKSHIEKRMLVEFQDEMVNELTNLGDAIKGEIIQENIKMKFEIIEMKRKMDETNEMLRVFIRNQEEKKEVVEEIVVVKKKGLWKRLFQ